MSNMTARYLTVIPCMTISIRPATAGRGYVVRDSQNPGTRVHTPPPPPFDLPRCDITMSSLADISDMLMRYLTVISDMLVRYLTVMLGIPRGTP